MRRREYLNGEWNFMPDYQNREPEDVIGISDWEQQSVSVPSSWRWSLDPSAEFQPYDLFHYPMRWNDAQAGVLRRTFRAEVPEGMRVLLTLDGVLERSVIFLNGVKVSESSEAYLPLRIDVTGLLRSGAENELRVWCGPFERVETPTGQKVLAPNGSWFAQLARGIWQDVYLEYRPQISLQDVFVKTSTRGRNIAVQAQVCAVCAEAGRATNLAVRADIWDGDRIVKSFQWQTGGIAAGQSRTVSYQADWADAVEWSPENPHLYILRMTLLDGETVLDTAEQRFGFREVWFEGHKFFLNGRRVNLRGDAWHYQGFVQQTREYAANWFRACKATGANFVRLHAMPYPEFYLDVADEMGMLIIDESAIYGSSKLTASDHPVFLARCREHLRNLLLRDRNHPSVIVWSMQNEMRWVDGRDGYKAAMRGLTAEMKALDDTRCVSYDGDNRLVDPDQMEIVSMHYNIDGTVASWDKARPLIFGEHGPWHYVSPQTCSALGGPAAYRSYAACEEAIGLNERLFLEYARREEVTGISPFDMANYAVWTMPAEAVTLEWPDPSAPGPKPRQIPAHSLTIQNGLIPEKEIFIPNPSWAHLKAGFEPVTVFRNEYNTSFYSGCELKRSFSVYNDTERAADVCLDFRFRLETGEVLQIGSRQFHQDPGSRFELDLTLPVPAVAALTQAVLELKLFHAGELAHSTQFEYKLSPPFSGRPKIVLDGKAVLIGGEGAYQTLSRLIAPLERRAALEECSLDGVDLVILEKNFTGKPGEVQPVLDAFVCAGGCVLVLEQDNFTLGDLTLADRGFFSAFASDWNHPILEGLSEQDLRFWQPENIHDPKAGLMVKRAFNKPVNGDCKIMLECGAGDFGWGGLLWTPLLEYRVGAGKIIFNQFDLIDSLAAVPQAAMILYNLLAYAARTKPAVHKAEPFTVLAAPDSDAAEFLRRSCADLQVIAAPEGLSTDRLLVVDPHELDAGRAAELKAFVTGGGTALVLPARPEQAGLLSVLAGQKIQVEPGPVYQVRSLSNPATAFVSDYDLYHIEKVTYTPGTYQNRVICSHRLAAAGGDVLLQDVHNPWFEYFIAGHDDEFRKVAMATLNRDAAFTPSTYGLSLPVGQGRLIFCQVLLAENEKVTRFYNRLLSNLGGAVDTPLLRYQKEEHDFGIEAFMALPREDHQDFAAMLAYFSAPDYILNNLGEGVFGWMKRVEKHAGAILLPGSCGKTCFLTAFIDSAINRDPSRRANNILPDPSLVPDLFLDANCAAQVFVNGREVGSRAEAPNGVVKIEDVVLSQGINRLALVVRAGDEDARLSVWFKDKFGEPLSGLKVSLTMD